MDSSTPGFSGPHRLPKFAQVQVHVVHTIQLQKRTDVNTV